MINIGKEEEEGNTVSSETDKEMNAVRSRLWNMPDQSSEKRVRLVMHREDCANHNYHHPRMGVLS